MAGGNEVIDSAGAEPMSSVTPSASLRIEGKIGILLARIQTHGLKVLLVFSLCVLCFAYGLSVGLFKIFPYSTITNAGTASRALMAVNKEPDDSVIIDVPKHVLVPTVQSYSHNDSKELILVSGGLSPFLIALHA